MSYTIVEQSGCCGSNALYSKITSDPSIDLPVFSWENCQGGGKHIEYIITNITDTEITCRVTNMTITPDNEYLDEYIRRYHRFSSDFVPIESLNDFEDDDNDYVDGEDGKDYYLVKNIYYLDGALYKMTRDGRPSYEEMREKMIETLPWKVGDERIFKR